MSISLCALCNEEITEITDSKEHIIPRSIGGRKKVTGFICETCNNTAGAVWDVELAKQFNALGLFFSINRQGNDVPSQTFAMTDGSEVRMNANATMTIAKPSARVYKDENGATKIQLIARDMDEARRMLKQQKKKYPSIDIDAILAGVQPESFYPEGMIKLIDDDNGDIMGGLVAGRSFIKSTLAQATASGISPQTCEHALDFLKNENGFACFGYFYERDLLINRPQDIIFHCVAVQGLPDSKQLLGYLELFSVFRVVVLLSDQYEGKAFSSSYAIDPINGDQLELDADINLSRSDILEVFDYKKVSSEAYAQAWNHIIPIGMDIAAQRHNEKVSSEAVQYAYDNLGVKDGESLTEEQKEKIVPLIMEKLLPYIEHLTRK